MADFQQFIAQLVTDIANLIPLGYAFGAGMVSAVNPCGFAMLPAYLGLFLGSKELVMAGSEGEAGASLGLASSVPEQVFKALVVTFIVTAGFVLLFGVVGLVISAGGRLIISAVPWLALGIGVALAVLGIAILRGYHLSATFADRIAERMGNPANVGMKGFFVFGVAYATASLSCTLPIFLTVIGGSLAVTGFLASAVQFVSYGLGMGLIILVLTVSIAIFKGAVVSKIQALLPHVERVSAVLLLVAGTYIVYYWLFKGGLIDTFI
ncbi:MAG: cytochrome c biogenesis protein CcdA [Chloroflexi bacterium]|nr:cytochrome c biogenesis protein CcdA [Chloroflexota bacterium]